jgi:hypothetical protein
MGLSVEEQLNYNKMTEIIRKKQNNWIFVNELILIINSYLISKRKWMNLGWDTFG